MVSGIGSEVNVMAADWITRISREPYIIGVSIAPTRYTHKLILQYKEFVVSVPTINMLKDVWVAGTEHGPQKIRKLKITFISSKSVKVPSIKEAIANLECKLIDSKTYGDHTLFVGEVIDYTYQEDVFTNGMPNPRVKYLLHIGGSQFITVNPQIHDALK